MAQGGRMLNIGCHLSASKGFLNMARETSQIKGNTFQFFTRNPRGGQAKDLNSQFIKENIKMANNNMKRSTTSLLIKEM